MMRTPGPLIRVALRARRRQCRGLLLEHRAHRPNRVRAAARRARRDAVGGAGNRAVCACSTPRRRPLRATAPRPRSTPQAAAPVVQPAPRALADAVAYVGSVGSLPPRHGNPFRVLIAAEPRAAGSDAGHGARDDRSVDDAGRAGRAARRARARVDRRGHAGRRRAVRAASLGRGAGGRRDLTPVPTPTTRRSGSGPRPRLRPRAARR